MHSVFRKHYDELIKDNNNAWREHLYSAMKDFYPFSFTPSAQKYPFLEHIVENHPFKFKRWLLQHTEDICRDYWHEMLLEVDKNNSLSPEQRMEQKQKIVKYWENDVKPAINKAKDFLEQKFFKRCQLYNPDIKDEKVLKKNIKYYSKLKKLIDTGSSRLFLKQLEEALANGYLIDFSPTEEKTSLLNSAVQELQTAPSPYNQNNTSERNKILYKINHLLNHGAKCDINTLKIVTLDPMELDIFRSCLERCPEINETPIDDSGMIQETVFAQLCFLYCNTFLPSNPLYQNQRADYETKIKLLLEAGADPNKDNGWKQYDIWPTTAQQEAQKHLFQLIESYKEQKTQLAPTANNVFWDYEI